MKGLINSVRFTIVMTDLFTMMGHTQANREVNDGTYRSFNLSPFPISDRVVLPQQTTSDLKITFANNSRSSKSPSSRPIPSHFSFQFMLEKRSYHFFSPDLFRPKFRTKFNSDKNLVVGIGENRTDSPRKILYF